MASCESIDNPSSHKSFENLQNKHSVLEPQFEKFLCGCEETHFRLFQTQKNIFQTGQETLQKLQKDNDVNIEVTFRLFFSKTI